MIHRKLAEKISGEMYRVAMFLELLISAFLIVAIVLNLIYVVSDMRGMISGNELTFQTVLNEIMMVVIGIEFLKMLCRHNMGSAIEVLLFAIARQMIIEHTTPLENLLSVAAIALLFLVRKYLFIKGLDDRHRLDPEPADESAENNIKEIK